MSTYAITRIEKLKGPAAIAGVEKHNERKKITYKSNPNINMYMTSQNYHLIEPTESYNKFIKHRLEEAGVKRIRKDSVLFQDAIVTASPEFFEGRSYNQVKEFFSRAMDFFSKKFGRENIMSAVVHVDERTPHMHFAFVPITQDGRLSSKDLIGGPKGLRQLQDDFYEYMHKEYKDLDRGIPKRETKREHLPTDVYKQVADLTKETQELYKVLDGMSVLDMKERKKYLMEKFSSLEPELEKVSRMVKASENSVRDISRMQSYVNNVEADCRRAIRDNRYDHEQETKDLKKEIRDLNSLLNKYINAIGDLPDYYRSQVLDDVATANMEKQVSKGYER